jgi:hypothetical protein
LPGVGDALSKTAQATLKGWDVLGTYTGKLPGAQTAKKQAVKFFAPGGGLEPKIRANLREVQGLNRSLQNEISNALSRYDRLSRKIVKESAKRSGRTDFMKQMQADVTRYFDQPVGRPLAQKYGADFQDVVDELVSVDNQLTDVLMKNLEDIVAEY